VKYTTADAFPALALTDVGAPGIAYGVTEALEDEFGPVPAALVAFTVNVYAVPLVNPVTTSGLEDPVAVNDPGELVTV
jgi:hypothetical protein